MKKYKFLFFTLLLAFLFFPKDAFALNDGAGVAFADTRGEIITSFDYDYEVNTYVKNVKYIYMYTASDNVKGNGYNLFYDFAFITPLNYGMGMQPIYFLSNRQEINFSKSWQLVDQYALGDRYYTRYHMNIDYIAQSSNANYQLTLQLNAPTDIIFYSVYNKKFSQTSGSSASEIEAGVKDIIDNQNQNTDKLIDNQNKNQQQTNDKLDKLEQSITSEHGPNLDSLENSAGWLPAGPVDSILNLPFSFFENLTDNLSKTCQPVALTFPFTNTNFQLPCISTLYEKIGIQDFLNWLGVIVSAIILYRYFVSLYKWVDDTLTFRENNHSDWGGV